MTSPEVTSSDPERQYQDEAHFAESCGAVSVVVCTRGRGPLITSTIESVLASVGVAVELVVIDQSVDDETAQAVASMPPDARLRYHRSDTVGVSSGRNIGIGMASQAIVLITDDDVTVANDWAHSFLKAIEPMERVAVAFCRVDAGPHDDTTGFIPDHFVDKPVLVRSLRSKSRARGIGAGMAVRRDAVLALGGFDEQLGPGSPLRSGEDRDLAARVLSRGWWLLQTPEPVVVHHGFRTWAEGKALARRDWFGIGAAYAKQLKCGNLQILPVIAHEVGYFGIARPAIQWLMGRRRVGMKRIGYFIVGFTRGLGTPVERRNMLYAPTRSVD